MFACECVYRRDSEETVVRRTEKFGGKLSLYIKFFSPRRLIFDFFRILFLEIRIEKCMNIVNCLKFPEMKI